MGVGDDGMLAVHRTMIQIEEPLGFPLPHHIAGIFVAPAYFDLPGRRSPLARLQLALAFCCTVLFDGLLQLRQILDRLYFHPHHIKLVLIRIGFKWVASLYNTSPVTKPRYIANSTISSNNF